jgi:hypothetical protein
MRLWPPLLWLPVYVASEFILIGSDGDAGMLIAGAALALIAFGLSLYLALGRQDRDQPRPRPALAVWAVVGVGILYVLMAIAAATAGVEYGAAALAAGVIPMTAVSLTIAVTRQKTVATEHGMRDLSSDDAQDPHPGIGMDDQTPLGDTPEHSSYWDEAPPAGADDADLPQPDAPADRAQAARRRRPA